MIRTMRKLNPSSLDPGSNELYFVGSPNKYLTDPAFVINQDTRRVAKVDNISNTGNDPKCKHIYQRSSGIEFKVPKLTSSSLCLFSAFYQSFNLNEVNYSLR